ncbi:tRNA (guanine-N(7)-)-methyltransferase (tRNA(m7G46)-methyltransferase), partial [Spiromyces aspiralis]
MNSLIEDFYSKGRLHSALQRLKTFSESGKYQDSKRPPSEAERAENEKCVISEYLRPIVEDLLPLVMGDGSLGFGPHRIIVREILASTLLTSILRAVSDPDTINKLVDMKLTRLIEEQRMLNKLREALDLQSSPLETPNTLGREGAGGSEPSGGILGRSTRPKVTRTYEEFIDMIKRCQDLEELDSMHGAVVSHIRKKRILIMGQNKDDIVHGEKVRDIIVYINRLYVAKKLIEKRITLLTRA